MKFNCPQCGLPFDKVIKDKIGQRCDECGTGFEVDAAGEIHPLKLKGARYTSTEGGNVCTGFGGLAGEIDVSPWRSRG